MRFDWTRWAFYLAVGPPFLLTLFMIPSRYLKTVLLIFMLVFVEAVLLTWRPIGYIAFSLTGAMAYVMVASLLTHPEARRSMLALGLPWLLFISSGLIAVLIGGTSRVSDAATNWLYFQQFYLEGILFFWIGRTAVRDGPECEKVLHWLIYFGAGAAILHYFSLATGYTFYASSGPDTQDPEAWRYGGLFANPNSMADFYAAVLPIALVCRLGWSRPSQRTGLLILLSSGLMLGSLLVTGSRGGTAATMVTLSLSMLLLPISLRSAIGVLFVAGLTIGLAYFTVTSVVQGGLDLTIERFQSRGAEDIRYEVWAKTIGSILQHPFGIGLDPYIYGDTLRIPGVRSSHNVYLELASQTGVVGLVAFLWLVGASMRGMWRARSSSSPHAKTAATALFVGVAGFLLGGITEPLYHNSLKFQRIIWVMLGMGSAAPIWAGLRSAVSNAQRTAHGEEQTSFPSDAEPALPGRRAS